MLAAILIATLIPQCPAPEAWLDGDRATAEERTETRQEVRRTCLALGASETACEALDIVTVRESSGDKCAAHVKGRKEFGLGPHGISVRWHLWRWDKTADPRVLHNPAISTVVALRIWRHASRTGATAWVDLQRVYAGRGRDVGQPVGDRDRGWCSRLRRRGISCLAPVDDLGKGLGVTPYPTQAEDLERLLSP